MKWPLAAVIGVLFAAQLALSFMHEGKTGLAAVGAMRLLLLVISLIVLARGWMLRRGMKPGTGPASRGEDEAIPSAADAARRRLWG